MVGLAGVLGVTAGGIAASLSRRFQAHAEAFETATGLLLLAGLALVGCGLPNML